MFSTLLAALAVVAIAAGLVWQERRIRRLRSQLQQLHAQQQALVRNLAARDTAAEIIRAAGATAPQAAVTSLSRRRQSHLRLVRGEHGLVALVAVVGGWFVARQTRVAAVLAILSAGTLVSSTIAIAPHQQPAQSRSNTGERQAPVVTRTGEAPPPLIITTVLPAEGTNVASTPLPPSVSSAEVTSATRETTAEPPSSESSSAEPRPAEPRETSQPETAPSGEAPLPAADSPPPTTEPEHALLSDLVEPVRGLLLG